MSDHGFNIVDRRTGQRITSLSYITERGAEKDIRALWHRQRAGTLLAVGADVLANATVIPREASDE